MNTKIISKIIMLLAVVVMTGCAGTEVQRVVEVEDRPILSATEAQSMIRVSVRTLPPTPVEDPKTIIAANDL